MASKRGPRAPRKVKAISFCLCDANILIADVEPEDLDLGNFDQDGLAFDVDENMDQEDQEALDSDDEQKLDEELGLEGDSDGTHFYFCSLDLLHFPSVQCLCILFPCTPSYQARNRCVSSSHPRPGVGLLSSLRTLPKLRLLSRVFATLLTADGPRKCVLQCQLEELDLFVSATLRYNEWDPGLPNLMGIESIGGPKGWPSWPYRSWSLLSALLICPFRAPLRAILDSGNTADAD